SAVRLAAPDPLYPFLVVWVRDSEARQLDFSTFVRRGDVPGFEFAAPAVRERDFGRHAIDIRDVPLTPHSRINLRVWLLDMVQQPGFDIRVTGEDGRVIAERNLPLSGSRLYTHGAFETLFNAPIRKKERVRFHISLGCGDAPLRLWGFLTISEEKDVPPKLYVPSP